jgi:hypothetical protein
MIDAVEFEQLLADGDSIRAKGLAPLETIAPPDAGSARPIRRSWLSRLAAALRRAAARWL